MPAVSLDGLRVLVVDDNATNRRILEEVLKHWSAVPTLASSGIEALARMKRAEAAGNRSTWRCSTSTCRKWTASRWPSGCAVMPRKTGPSILMLSSADHSDALQRCRDLSLSAYIVKPVTQSDLYMAILMALGAAPGPLPRVRSCRSSGGRPVAALRVLLAEDNPVNQKLAIHLLESAGHEVWLAQNGIQAVELYRRETFDLVCMDLQMPEMGGLDATAEIRQIEARTGTRTPDHRPDRARHAGRPRAVSRRRHGRLRVEADRTSTARRGDQPRPGRGADSDVGARDAGCRACRGRRSDPTPF